MNDLFENIALLFALMFSGAGVTVVVLVLFLKFLDFVDNHDRS